MEPLTWLFQFLFCFLQYQVAASSSSPLSSFASSAHPLCRHDQRSALLQFKHIFTINSHYLASSKCDIYYGIPSYPKTLYWDENATDCCNWDGVTCDGLTGHVIGLDLSCSRLYGKIHPNSSLFQLSHLQRLNLAHNDFHYSSISPAFGSLASLTHLNLSDSVFSGSIPSEISYLYRLISLDLSSYLLRFEPLQFKKFLKNMTRLQELVLRGVDIFPSLPEALTNLSSLTTHDLTLDLSLIELQGNLPDSMGYPKSSNQHMGPIPFNLSGLQNLRVLYLSHNSIRGEIPPSLFTLPSLMNLDLSFNHLTGQIPEFQHHLPLVSIDLSDNKLRGSIPHSISTLANLTRLSLASNDLSGVVDLQILKNVEYLSVSNTNLSVVAGSNANNTLPNLRNVYMSSCNIDVFPYFLRASVNLEELDLSVNKIHGKIPNWFGFIGKASLSYLDLRSNLLQGPLPIPPPLIKYFSMSNNCLSGEIPSLICNASFLEILDLSHNKLSGAVPQCLGNFSSFLVVLNLQSNGFKGTFPLAFAKPNKLKSLDLSANQFEGPLPRSLTNCMSLEVLNVRNNKINDTFPYWLGTLPELQVLILGSNRFHGPINTMMSEYSFPKVQILDLSSNEFIGPLPGTYFEYFRAMKNWPDKHISDKRDYYHDSLIVTMNGISGIEWVRILIIFNAIDLSSNNFSGEIPNAVGKLDPLIWLNFSHNNLTGHIPESLGDLTSIEVLDISSNHLTGRIPSQLTSLAFLSILNVSWNRLHGPIPRGVQFDTFDSSSYTGNIELCGRPLSKECEDNRTKVQPLVLQHEEDDSDFDGFTWKIVVIGYGCGMTLGLFLGCLMFLIGRPKFFVRFAEIEKPKKVTRLRRLVGDTTGRRK